MFNVCWMGRIMQKIFKIVVLWFFVCSCYAQTSEDKLTQLLLNIKTFEANFTQTIKDKNSRLIQQTFGKIYLERPGKFRWQVTKPNAQLIIANGNKLWVYDPDLQQVTIQHFSQATNQTPAYLLSDNNLNLAHNFNIKQTPQISQIANAEVFNLTPKEHDAMFSSIRLTFINKQIRQMELQDNMGHFTSILFGNVKMGEKLSNNLFEFTAPPNVDVLDETKKRQ